jgi:hypothetical protein
MGVAGTAAPWLKGNGDGIRDFLLQPLQGDLTASADDGPRPGRTEDLAATATTMPDDAACPSRPHLAQEMTKLRDRNLFDRQRLLSELWSERRFRRLS